LAGETEVLGENLPQRHFVHHKSHMTRPGLEPRAAAVGSQRLTAWAMARPRLIELLYRHLAGRTEENSKEPNKDIQCPDRDSNMSVEYYHYASPSVWPLLSHLNLAVIC
jgi:hypothetical protein